MIRRYCGKYVQEEKSFWKTKYVTGNLLIQANSFAEAQERLSNEMSRLDRMKNIKICFITPYFITEEES